MLCSCVDTPRYTPAYELDGKLIINEIVPGTGESGSSWVEVVNISSSDTKIAGLKLLVTDDYYYRFVLYEAPDAVLAAGERLIVSTADGTLQAALKAGKLEEVALAAGNDSIVALVDVKAMSASLGVPASGGSWSRIPDLTGDFIVTETATPDAVNYKFVPHKIDGMRLNEMSLSGNWVELVNSSSGQLEINEMTLYKTTSAGQRQKIYQCDLPALKGGGRIVVDADLSDMKRLELVSNEGKTVDAFSQDSLAQAGTPAAEGSYSRLPDLSGRWYVSGAATKNAINNDSTADLTGLVINEYSPSGKWVEILNTTVRTIRSKGASITAGDKVIATLDSDMEPGARKVFEFNSSSSEIIMKAPSGKVIDTFSPSSSKDGLVPDASGSWSRIPDGSDWYAVRTSSRESANYGIIKGNRTGIWVSQSSTPSVEKVMDQFVKMGIGHIFLHEWCFKNYGHLMPAIFEKAERLGVTIHIWLQCFWWNDNKGVNGWRSPVIDSLQCYDQALFDDILGENRASKYVKAGAKGIHFDYIRYGGTAYRHDFPEKGVTGVGSINEFLRQADERLRGINPDLILSAALMAEKNSERYYGQRPEDMGQVLDILIPMIYRHSSEIGPTTCRSLADHFATEGYPAECWAGTQTYDKNSASLSADNIYYDCHIYDGSQAKGVVLFRYGLGSLPSLLDLKLADQ